MQSTDRELFDALIVKLCAAFDKPVGDRQTAYFEGLSKMSIVQFSRVVDFAISEKGPDKLPTTKMCWSIFHLLKSQPALTLPAEKPKPEDPRDHILFFANRMFLRHMQSRGGLGDELAPARKALLDVVSNFCQALDEGDDLANPSEFTEHLMQAIDQVSKLTPATRAEWQKRASAEGGRKPFPRFMSRPIDPKYSRRTPKTEDMQL